MAGGKLWPFGRQQDDDEHNEDRYQQEYLDHLGPSPFPSGYGWRLNPHDTDTQGFHYSDEEAARDAAIRVRPATPGRERPMAAMATTMTGDPVITTVPVALLRNGRPVNKGHTLVLGDEEDGRSVEVLNPVPDDDGRILVRETYSVPAEAIGCAIRPEKVILELSRHDAEAMITYFKAVKSGDDDGEPPSGVLPVLSGLGDAVNGPATPGPVTRKPSARKP